MKLRYRFRIYPNAEQVKSLSRLFGCTRVVWNDALAFCQDAWKQGVKYPGSSAKMDLSVREWECLFCGAMHDRDVNAALNIKAAGGHSEAQNGHGGRRKSKFDLVATCEVSTHLLGEQLCLNF